MQRFFVLLAVGALLSVPAVSSAQIIYDAIPDNGTAFVNQVFPDFPDFSTYLVADVTIASDVTLGVIEIYGTESTQAIPTMTWEGNVTSGTFNIFPKTGALPDNVVDDPTAGTIVPIDCLDVNGEGGTGTGQYMITACGINMDLTAGDYWIGLTYDADFATFGQVFTFGSLTIQGEQAAARNPGNAFALGTDWFQAGEFSVPPAPWELAMQLREPEACGGGGGTFCPSSWNLFRGVLLEGDLASFCGVDDNVLRIRPGPVLISTDAPAWPEVFGNVGAGPGPSTVLSITSNVDTTGLTYTVEVRNYTTGQRDIIGTQGGLLTESTFTYPLTADHVDANGDVESRIGWRKTGLSFLFPWTVTIDDISWVVQ